MAEADDSNIQNLIALQKRVESSAAETDGRLSYLESAIRAQGGFNIKQADLEKRLDHMVIERQDDFGSLEWSLREIGIRLDVLEAQKPKRCKNGRFKR
jgi:hypothetical protein